MVDCGCQLGKWSSKYLGTVGMVPKYLGILYPTSKVSKSHEEARYTLPLISSSCTNTGRVDGQVCLAVCCVKGKEGPTKG